MTLLGQCCTDSLHGCYEWCRVVNRGLASLLDCFLCNFYSSATFSLRCYTLIS